jgi:hypothetical protein
MDTGSKSASHFESLVQDREDMSRTSSSVTLRDDSVSLHGKSLKRKKTKKDKTKKKSKKKSKKSKKKKSRRRSSSRSGSSGSDESEGESESDSSPSSRIGNYRRIESKGRGDDDEGSYEGRNRFVVRDDENGRGSLPAYQHRGRRKSLSRSRSPQGSRVSQSPPTRSKIS